MSDGLLERTLERHRAFWAMAAVPRPLVSSGRYRPLEPREPLPLADGTFAEERSRLLPERLDVGRLAGWRNASAPAISGDFIHGAAPYDFCWNEAIAGCAIRWSAGHVWSEPFLDRLEDMERLRMAPDSPWLAKLQEFAAVLAARAGGRYPIVQPLLRGPIDIAAAAYGDERVCWAMIDEPHAFRRLLALCTDNFLAVARTWQSLAQLLPLFRRINERKPLIITGAATQAELDTLLASLSPRGLALQVTVRDEKETGHGELRGE